ncbi:hypothetical protein [Kocuria sp. SL71]|uniref:hypothetical protein n=1 Tax=Kocuria sp. SL71 TaxID=2995151 RepID=UPI0022741578|nr:hypothetical protein [Kocuria sp. SL71]MCY1683122.1 hypothetical protein [Kocuria sp. SL71]
MLAEAVCQRVDQVPASAVIAQHSLAAVQVQTGGQGGRAQQLRGDRLQVAVGLGADDIGQHIEVAGQQGSGGPGFLGVVALQAPAVRLQVAPQLGEHGDRARQVIGHVRALGQRQQPAAMRRPSSPRMTVKASTALVPGSPPTTVARVRVGS